MLTKKEDLAALKKTDKLLVSFWSAKKDSEIIEITDKVFLQRLKGQFKTKEVPPSGAFPWVVLRWEAKGKVVKVMWLMEHGEWGFSREGTNWTVGKNQKLVELLKQKLANKNR